MAILGDLCELPDLPDQLLKLVAQIPTGRVTTYGDLADALGDRIASRWVGHFLLHHSHGTECHCHRVVRAGGELGRYVSGDVDEKAEQLRSEGVAVQGNRVDLSVERFRDFRCLRELQRLRDIQHEMLSHLSLVDQPAQTVVAGVDVSYSGSDGVAAYVEVDAAGDVSWSTTVRRPIRFPYISSYLAFRELPLLLELFQQVQEQHSIADVLLVDGSGIAHPRRTGIATMLGIATETPTIGITKRLLHGRVDLSGLTFGELRPIREDDVTIGYATLAWSMTRKPIYLSPGHLISVESTAHVVRRFLGTRRLPTPIYWADRISRRETENVRTRRASEGPSA